MDIEATNRAHLRDKDIALETLARQGAAASTEGVEWLGQHQEQTPRILGLQKQLRRQTVEARRLATAAARPMSVGVFGASQMGKSFLIGKLICPEDNPAKVIFGDGDTAVRQDFLEDVNPSGGDETTGLVTRFSLRRYETPPDNPVVLRMLREVDIIKILANTFRFDLKGQYRHPGNSDGDTVDDRTPTPDRIDALADSLNGLKSDAPQPGLTIEDVFELREYVEKHLDDHLLAREEAEPYWVLLENTLPHLDHVGRVRALGPLWAELEEFDDLYGRLRSALDQLGHPERIYTGLSALADRSKGVLHVNTLRDLDAAGTVEMLSVVSDTGAAVPLPMCIVTALTAELCVTLETAPWVFFTHTDLLDFPGARSRENKTVQDFLRDPSEPQARSNCFLRGKVAVLFDNYAADLDLNVMLLCAGPENQEVKSLPGLVRDWIARTHGDTPQRRQGRPTALFYCLTKCDMMFIRKKGQDDPISTRFENNLKPYAAWVNDWTPNAPFDNLFLIRNPAIEDRGVFTYEESLGDAAEGFVPPETGLTETFQSYLDDSFRPAFMADDMVKTHVANPAEKLEQLLRLNDGGTSLLAEALAPVCNPDLKYDQIQPRAEKMRANVGAVLSDFFETGDLQERLEKRTARIEVLISALARKPIDIGPFIASFQIDEGLMDAAYRHYRRSSIETPPEENVFEALFGDEDDQDQAGPPASFGKVLVAWWAEHLSGKIAGNPWCEHLGIGEDTLAGLVEELVIGAEREEVAHRLEASIDEYTVSSMRLDAAARKIATISTLMLNAQLNYPSRDVTQDGGDWFGQTDSTNSCPVPGLPEDPKSLQRIRLTYFKHWMDGLKDLTVQNASWGTGGAVDVEANSKLGAILKRLQGAT